MTTDQGTTCHSELTTIEPIGGSPGPWRNIAFDHLAITVTDRQAAYEFFTGVLKMQEMRHGR